jgi:hypothetical protein
MAGPVIVTGAALRPELVRLASHGLGFRAMTSNLNARGITAPRGGWWSPAQVRDTLYPERRAARVAAWRDRQRLAAPLE